jgi:hypothetical protein
MRDFKIGVAIIMAFFHLNLQPAMAEESKIQAVQRARDEKINLLLKEIQHLKSTAKSQSGFSLDTILSATDHANKDCDNAPSTCVPFCTLRYHDGRCGRYGQDYCSPDANCSAYCTLRYHDGRCGRYGQDYCGPDANCSAHCTLRYSDGRCGAYGPDICY